MNSLLILLFGRFRWYRRFAGGSWARSTEKAPIGAGLWIPYEPIDLVMFTREVELGNFQYERHPRRGAP